MIHLILDFTSFKYGPGYRSYKDEKFTSELPSYFSLKVNQYLDTPFDVWDNPITLENMDGLLLNEGLLEEELLS